MVMSEVFNIMTSVYNEAEYFKVNGITNELIEN